MALSFCLFSRGVILKRELYTAYNEDHNHYKEKTVNYKQMREKRLEAIAIYLMHYEKHITFWEGFKIGYYVGKTEIHNLLIRKLAARRARDMLKIRDMFDIIEFRSDLDQL